jgi:hypothetical protein
LCRLASVCAVRKESQNETGAVCHQSNGWVLQMSEADGSKGEAGSDGYEEFWATLPKKAGHPDRATIIEALWWIGEPLSAIALVDLFDGLLSMWEVAHHLRELEKLNVVESVEASLSRPDLLDLPYCLKDRNSGKEA